MPRHGAAWLCAAFLAAGRFASMYARDELASHAAYGDSVRLVRASCAMPSDKTVVSLLPRPHSAASSRGLLQRRCAYVGSYNSTCAALLKQRNRKPDVVALYRQPDGIRLSYPLQPEDVGGGVFFWSKTFPYVYYIINEAPMQTSQ